MDTNPWLALSHIMGGLGIPDGSTKTTTRDKLILLSSKNISNSASATNKNSIMKTYPSSNRYVAFPGTKEGRKYMDAFIRKRSGVGSWRIIVNVSTSIINCIIKTKNDK